MASIIDDPLAYMSTPAVVRPKDDPSLNKIVEGSVAHIERLEPGWWQSPPHLDYTLEIPHLDGGSGYDRRTALGHEPMLSDGTPVHGYDGFREQVTTIRVISRGRVVGCIPRKRLSPRTHQAVTFQTTPQFNPMDPGADWHQVECFAMTYKSLTVDGGFTYETVLDATGVDKRLLEGIDGWRPSLS